MSRALPGPGGGWEQLALFEPWRHDRRRGIFSSGKAVCRGDPLWIARQTNEAWRKKVRRLGVLTRFGHGQNKKPLPLHGTKAVASAIPPKLTFQTSTRLRVPSYAPRWITGGIPVGPYSVSPFGPPSEVHSPAAPRPASTIRDSLKVCHAGYFSPSQVCRVLLLWCIIRTRRAVVNPLEQTFLFN